MKIISSTFIRTIVFVPLFCINGFAQYISEIQVLNDLSKLCPSHFQQEKVKNLNESGDAVSPVVTLIVTGKVGVETIEIPVKLRYTPAKGGFYKYELKDSEGWDAVPSSNKPQSSSAPQGSPTHNTPTAVSKTTPATATSIAATRSPDTTTNSTSDGLQKFLHICRPNSIYKGSVMEPDGVHIINLRFLKCDRDGEEIYAEISDALHSMTWRKFSGMIRPNPACPKGFELVLLGGNTPIPRPGTSNLLTSNSSLVVTYNDAGALIGSCGGSLSQDFFKTSPAITLRPK